jgi:hypothetical protein
MDVFDDYQDDVERLSPEQIEAILSGEETSSSTPLTALFEDVRLGLLEHPSAETTARHVAAMVSAAREVQLGAATAPGARKRSMRLFTRRRLAGMALAATLVLGAGIAAAITLPPRAADRAREVVPSIVPPETPPPEQLPEQASHGQAVSSFAKDSALQGCEKGQAVAAIASAKAAEARNNPAKTVDPCSRSEIQGNAKSGRPLDSPGRSGEAPGRSPGSRPKAGGRPDVPPGLNARGGGSGRADVGGGEGSGGPGGGGGNGSGGSSIVPPSVPEDLPTP